MTIRLPTLDRFKQVQPCNGCTVCCTEAAVKELGKPARCRCEHQTETGCGIYGRHPAECRSYACAWAMGALGADDRYRPDRCGMLFSLSTTDAPPSINVFIRAGEWDPEKVSYLLHRVRRRFPGFPLTRIYPPGVRVGSAFESKPPYPAELSNRSNVFAAHIMDLSTLVCEGPQDDAGRRK